MPLQAKSDRFPRRLRFRSTLAWLVRPQLGTVDDGRARKGDTTAPGGRIGPAFTRVDAAGLRGGRFASGSEGAGCHRGVCDGMGRTALCRPVRQVTRSRTAAAISAISPQPRRRPPKMMSVQRIPSG